LNGLLSSHPPWYNNLAAAEWYPPEMLRILKKSEIFLQEHCIIKTLCCGTASGFAAYKGVRL